ncbi:capsular polysaccharide biosynthesis protein [Clostridium moniliforme]|uniref:Capsular polysaccharide biosynthesis protein n=1 Tax=Clostridium moniliforme TaxID=39489 RepID=A0ABS4EYU9_9CLOT|nr:Wzz/FepE/Etk N-terminal domain-containing protein [Clostridium moniliforme]MBP1889170.1 capsular polysaccharide biosynthesis protein [Clostridium moniliforme]
MSEENINIRKIISILKKKIKLIIGITALITVVTALISFFVITPKYEVKTKLFIGKEGSLSEEYNSSDVEMYKRLLTTYAEIMKSEDLINEALNSEKIYVEDKNVYKNLKVIPREDTQIIEVSYIDEDKYTAFKFANGLVDKFTEQSKKLIPMGNIQVIQKAKIPTNQVSPNKIMNISIAFILGIMISIGLVLILDFMDNTIKTKEDIIGIAILGDIPNLKNCVSKTKNKKRGNK